jgi:hypothetical protein
MPLGLCFKQNSLYNYGGISPNNLIMYHSTYNPLYYYNTGAYFGTGSTMFDLTVYKNNSRIINQAPYSGALSLNGIGTSTGGYTLSPNLSPYFASSNETQELWFKNSFYNQSGTNGVVISHLGQTGINTGYHHSNFEISGKTGYVGLFTLTIPGLSYVPVDTYIDGNWNCMAWTYSGTLLTVYSNGVRKNTLTVNRYFPTPSYHVSLGATDFTCMFTGTYFKGQIGSFKVYNRSLTSSEILQNYNYEKQFFVRSVRVNIIGPGETASWYADVITKITTAKNSLYPGYTLTITQNNSTSYTGSDLLTSNFDTVFIWTDAAYNSTLGTNLNNFVTSGGGLVICTFANASVSITNFTYTNCPIVYPNNQSAGANLTLGTYTSSDPLMNGVTSFNIGSAGYGASGLTLQSGATSVASYSNGNNLVAKKTIGSARTVSLNFFPPSSSARSDFWTASTNGDRLMTNAIMWTGKSI